LVLSLSKGITKLKYCQDYFGDYQCAFGLSPTNWPSLTLTFLQINVQSFDDCLVLIDKRLNCLSTLIIYVHDITRIDSEKSDFTKVVNRCILRRKVSKFNIFLYTLFNFYFCRKNFRI